jgi:acyl-homoserine lactone acylase PvdQ
MVAVVVAAGAAPASAAVAPYGTGDAGGFRNVLPPGEAGTDTLAQFGTFKSTGQRPPHYADQQSLYENLLYASPHLTHSQIASYYKDATFGVKPGDVESTESPAGHPGVTIVRDKQYGIPHIYGASRADVEFGAGYAGAEDRLFLMDVLRHTGRAQLSSFAGGSPGDRAMDRTQWAIAPYSEADLQRQIDLAPKIYGAAGTSLIKDGQAFVDGINAYINAATLTGKLPFEYTAFAKTPQPWKLTDVIAEASLIGGIFGKGGGQELRSALFLQALQHRFGHRAGQRAWADFRSKNDPEAPSTVLHQRFPYETASAFSHRGLAIPDPGSVSFAPVAPAVQSKRSAPDIGSQLMRAFASHPHASNWELVAARHSRNHHPIGVLGPQVGYYVPQILMEEDLHGPGFDARGATFPGVNLMVQLGHGRDYAWSATTATSDNVDTFAEVLCQDDFHYLYKGKCLPMERLDRSNSWTPSAGDPTTPPGSETLTAYRTVHGIVYARGRVHHRKVAFVSARTTYFHEADSAIGFFHLNDPGFVHDPQSFRRAVDGINFAFNWAYIDSKHIAYQLSGAYPQRARGTSPDFPVLGTGRYDWQGYNTSLHTMRTVPLDRRPHAVDPDYLVSWNNKQAPGWAAADDKFTYGSVFRSQMIEAGVRAGIRHGRKMGLEQLVRAMEEPASQDFESWALWPSLRRALGHPRNQRLAHAIHVLNRWYRAGSHRRDLDRNGKDEYGDAIRLMDAWWPQLTSAEFTPALGSAAVQRLRSLVRPASVMAGDGPAAPDYDDGWFSFVSKDIRDSFAPSHVHGRWSRRYCGRGSARRCRAALRSSLLRATKVTAHDLYAKGDCSSKPDPACFDQNRSVIASAIDMPPFPFQNRPTFQQTVELTRQMPR